MSKLIPKQLKQKGIGFCLIKKDSKDPSISGKGWQNNPLSFDDPKLLNHLKAKGNYGVVAGYGGIVILDADDKALADKLYKEHDTFTVQTCGSTYHFYFSCDEKIKNKVLNGGKGELRANSYMVVGPGCYAIDKKKGHEGWYTIAKDVPIKKITKAELEKIIEPYTKKEYATIAVATVQKDTTRSGKEYREICKLIAQGKSKEEVFTEMQAFKKWSEAQPNYKEATYNKAKIFIDAVRKNKGGAGAWILNSDDIWEDKLFSFDKLNTDVAYYGLLIPKVEEVKDKKGNFIYTHQVKRPALITSDRRIIPLNYRLQEEHKVRILEYPSDLRLRWKLESIKSWIDGLTTAKTFKEIFDLIKPQYLKFVSMQDIWADIHTLWDIGTYFFALFKVYPIFELRGVRATAKTKTMAVSRLITLNATDIMVNPSEPTLFRETNDKRPTKYIDEAENLFKLNQGKPEPDPRVEVINSSYRYNGCVPRQERLGSKFITVYYYTYSPTMISSINGLYGATEDRAIIRITTKPKKEDESKGNLEPEPIDSIWQDIRNELYISGLTYWQEISVEYNTLINNTQLKNRDYWLWKPLLIIAKKISIDLYDKVLKHAIKQQETKTADFIQEESIEYKILAIVYDILNSTDVVYVHDIYKKLPDSQFKPKEKTISSKLDKLGFRDFRAKDRNGSFFNIPHGMFEAIISPICPSLFSSQSSQSSQKNTIIDDNNKNNNVINSDECDEYNIIKDDSFDNLTPGPTKNIRHDSSQPSRREVTNVLNNTQNEVKEGLLCEKPNIYQCIAYLDNGKGATQEQVQRMMNCSTKDFAEYLTFALSNKYVDYDGYGNLILTTKAFEDNMIK